MKITREMVMELNNELAVKGCPFRYEYEGATEYSHIPLMQVALPKVNLNKLRRALSKNTQFGLTRAPPLFKRS